MEKNKNADSLMTSNGLSGTCRVRKWLWPGFFPVFVAGI
jgi:hypothetical protein